MQDRNTTTQQNSTDTAPQLRLITCHIHRQKYLEGSSCPACRMISINPALASAERRWNEARDEAVRTNAEFARRRMEDRALTWFLVAVAVALVGWILLGILVTTGYRF